MDITKQVTDREKLRNSRDGNPQWLFTFADGTALKTKANTAWAYVADSPEYAPGETITVLVNGRGSIDWCEPINEGAR